MTAHVSVEGWINQAEGVPATLGACWDAFEYIQRSADRYARPGSDLFPAFCLAAGAAGAGRDALGSAPSMPSGQGHPIDSLDPDSVALDDAANMLAVLAAQVNGKLAATATDAQGPGDRKAFLEAAVSAAEIRDLLG